MNGNEVQRPNNELREHFLSRWMYEWLKPSGVIVLVGVVVWLVQLNIGYSVLVKDVGKLYETQKIEIQLDADQSLQLAKTTVLLDNMLSRIQRNEALAEQVIRNSEKLNSLNKTP